MDEELDIIPLTPQRGENFYGATVEQLWVERYNPASWWYRCPRDLISPCITQYLTLTSVIYPVTTDQEIKPDPRYSFVFHSGRYGTTTVIYRYDSLITEALGYSYGSNYFTVDGPGGTEQVIKCYQYGIGAYSPSYVCILSENGNLLSKIIVSPYLSSFTIGPDKTLYYANKVGTGDETKLSLCAHAFGAREPAIYPVGGLRERSITVWGFSQRYHGPVVTTTTDEQHSELLWLDRTGVVRERLLIRSCVEVALFETAHQRRVAYRTLSAERDKLTLYLVEWDGPCNCCEDYHGLNGPLEARGLVFDRQGTLYGYHYEEDEGCYLTVCGFRGGRASP